MNYEERPISFDRQMVKLILGGLKRQTRRIVEPQPEFDLIKSHHSPTGFFDGDYMDATINKPVTCPWGRIGDRLWVREKIEAVYPANSDDPFKIVTYYPADGSYGPQLLHKQPMSGRTTVMVTMGEEWPYPDYRPIEVSEMPRWASRISLVIKDIRVERINDITNEDSVEEGISPNRWGEADEDGMRPMLRPPVDQFLQLWEELYPRKKWGGNPWVWVIEFGRIE